MQITFSKRESAYKAYEWYIKTGCKAKEPKQNGNLWIVVYSTHDTMNNSPAGKLRNAKHRKYEKTKKDKS